ncbi:MAG: polyprenyl synthetase family protein [Phycisphaerae bacterium]|nr:polyprenyl synthetase family protein [Phycisphaerae bacterium]
MQTKPQQTLTGFLEPYVEIAEASIASWAVEPQTPQELGDAMQYCLAGGKRLRPALVHLAAEATADGSYDKQLVAMCGLAVEMIHVYSLVHDDLPAMDDDDLRRGRPTAHVKFGEAMGILIGDALLTRAFGVLAESNAACAARLVTELAAAAGAAGMVAGQVADMQLCQLPDGFEGMQYIHNRKTAAMLRVSARLGAIAAGASEQNIQAVSDYAENLGMGFQLFDDLLDATGTAQQLGKTPGKDQNAGKRTVITELGIEKATQLGKSLTAAAADALKPLGPKAQPLKTLAKLLIDRTH